jgi:hypothetical protein
MPYGDVYIRIVSFDNESLGFLHTPEKLKRAFMQRYLAVCFDRNEVDLVFLITW